MSRRNQFSNKEYGLFSDALAVAEESISDYYRLSHAAWAAYPYEVRTLAELAPREISDQALAQVLRLRQPQRPGRLRGWDFFRICVQDHNLLGLVRREKAGDLMLPLLTYVLAHELVHVVRFYQFQHLFEASPQEKVAEEAKVYQITNQALEKVKLPSLGQVLSMYQKFHGAEGESLCPQVN